MTDIAIQRAPTADPTPTSAADSYRMIRDLFRQDPYREMAPVFDAEAVNAFTAPFEIKETKDGFSFKADVPGVKDADLEVTVTGSRLTIAGQRAEDVDEQGDQYYSCERRYGAFSRTFALPEGADAGNAHADLKAGVLTVVVPKLPGAQPKKIAVKSTGAAPPVKA